MMDAQTKKYEYKILIVDDVACTREALQRLVNSVIHNNRRFHFNFEFFHAIDDDSAQKVLNKNKIDLIFLDIQLQDKNGINVLQEIKQDLPHVMVVMISAECSINCVEKSFEYGAEGFIVKPFSIRKIEEALLKLINKWTNVQTSENV